MSTSQRTPTISVFIIASHPHPLFQKCLTSVLLALPKNGKNEIVVVLNGYQPEKNAWLQSIAQPHLRVVHSPKTCVSRLRNDAFAQCIGEILHFLDDDVVVPLTLFSDVLQTFAEDAELAILGGPNLTPKDSTSSEKIFGAVLTSRFAAPFVYKRYSQQLIKGSATGLDLIFCNLALRISKCPASQRFYEGLYPNEETLFLHHARRRKLKIQYSAHLYVYHYRRSHLTDFLKQIRSYGFGRGRQTLIEPLSLPLPFLWLGILSILFFGFFNKGLTGISLYCGGSLIAWISSNECRNTGMRGFLLAPFLTFCVHASYGLGFLTPFIQELVPRRMLTKKFICK